MRCATCGNIIDDTDMMYQSPEGKVYCSIECMNRTQENKGTMDDDPSGENL